MALINQKELKRRFEKKKMKIGRSALKEFIKNQELMIEEEIQKTVRKTIISGRKTVKISE